MKCGENTGPISYCVPSTVTSEVRASVAAWIETLPPGVAAVARKYPLTECYRSTQNPLYHYVIHGYDENEETGAVTVRLIHGSDSTLPGVATFGQPVSQLIPCKCGKWKGPTAEQTKRTKERVQARFGRR